jgi:hypothetical protein
MVETSTHLSKRIIIGLGFHLFLLKGLFLETGVVELSAVVAIFLHEFLAVFDRNNI